MGPQALPAARRAPDCSPALYSGASYCWRQLIFSRLNTHQRKRVQLARCYWNDFRDWREATRAKPVDPFPPSRETNFQRRDRDDLILAWFCFGFWSFITDSAHPGPDHQEIDQVTDSKVRKKDGPNFRRA